MIDSLFTKHERVTLLYSGGKDSLCCLQLLYPWIDRVDVVWVDTGDCFSEVKVHINKVKKLCPSFITLHGNVSEFIKNNGFPVDVIPITVTPYGQFMYGKAQVHLCDRVTCCRANLWAPVEAYLRYARPTCVVRGDRGEERRMGPTVVDGIEFVFPIFAWPTEKVIEAVKANPLGLFEDRHLLEHGSSLDCMSCMAYNDDYVSRMAFLKKNYPERYKLVKSWVGSYLQITEHELDKLREV